MSNVFKLDDIKSAANKVYSHFEVDLGDDLPAVVLRNVLQLSDDERKAMTEEKPEDETTLEALQAQVRSLADSAEGAERLIDAIGDNLAHFVQLIKTYNEETQAGEA